MKIFKKIQRKLLDDKWPSISEAKKKDTLEAIKEASKTKVFDYMTTATCNQCGKELNFRAIAEIDSMQICINPSCPNYALLQVPLEQMPKGKDI